MFRWYRIWAREKALAKARLDLQTFSHRSPQLQEECLVNIVFSKRADGLNWSAASGVGDSQEILYRLFTHQQHTGYLVENVRKKAYALSRLFPEKQEFLWKVGEDLGVSANTAQSALYQEFLVNMLPRLKQIEAEMYPKEDI